MVSTSPIRDVITWLIRCLSVVLSLSEKRRTRWYHMIPVRSADLAQSIREMNLLIVPVAVDRFETLLIYKKIRPSIRSHSMIY